MVRWSGPASAPVRGETVARLLAQLQENEARRLLGYLPGGRRQDVTRLGAVEPPRKEAGK